MKKIVRIAIILAVATAMMIIGTVAVMADTEEDYEYTVSDGKATVDGYNGNEISLEIPSTLGGYPVTSIGNCAFYGCESLTSITIPDGVTSIGDHAFYYCSRLTSITIPDGVTSIEESAFFGCSRLTSITIPEGVTSIEEFAFYLCERLTSITIPRSVISIGDDAFSDNTKVILKCDPPGIVTDGLRNVRTIQYPCSNAFWDEKERNEWSSTAIWEPSHEWKTVSEKKATITKDGVWRYRCENCGTSKKDIIKRVSNIALSNTSFIYNTATQKPTVIIKNSAGNKLDAASYTLTNSGRKTVGKGTVQVVLKGNYEGSVTLSYKVVPKKAAVKSASVGKRRVTVKMSTKVSSTGGSTYQIGYKQKGTSKWKYTTTTSQSKVIKSLKKGKKYYIKVRAYGSVGGIKYYGAWSAVKTSGKVR